MKISGIGDNLIIIKDFLHFHAKYIPACRITESRIILMDVYPAYTMFTNFNNSLITFNLTNEQFNLQLKGIWNLLLILYSIPKIL